MKITASTTPQEVLEKTKAIMAAEVVPTMYVKDTVESYKFTVNEQDNAYWLKRICSL